MKSLLAVIVFLLSTYWNANAQKDFRLGVKGGINIAQFNREQMLNDYVTAGYHFGVFGRIPISNHLSFQPEAQYSIKGTTFKEAIGGELTKAQLLLDYIDAIALLNLRFAHVLNLQGGLVLGILTDVQVKNKSEEIKTINPQQAIEENDFRLFDPGYTFGIEADLLKWIIGVRYTQGMRDISDKITYDSTTYSFPELRNSVYQVYIGLRFM